MLLTNDGFKCSVRSKCWSSIRAEKLRRPWLAMTMQDIAGTVCLQDDGIFHYDYGDDRTLGLMGCNQ